VNYFNYFTEIEEHFQRARNSGLFLLSPLDWAMIETWKEAGIPLEAVLKGIDRAFEKWRARKIKTRRINSLAYCAQEVLAAAQQATGQERETPAPQRQAPFEPHELGRYFRSNAAAVRAAARDANPSFAETLGQAAESLDRLAAGAEAGRLEDLEAAEQRLTVLEERLLASATQNLGEEEMLAARRRMEAEIAPYRRKMTAEQLVLLERQYLQRRILETAGLPRLSLFYLQPEGAAHEPAGHDDE